MGFLFFKTRKEKERAERREDDREGPAGEDRACVF